MPYFVISISISLYVLSFSNVFKGVFPRQRLRHLSKYMCFQHDFHNYAWSICLVFLVRLNAKIPEDGNLFNSVQFLVAMCFHQFSLSGGVECATYWPIYLLNTLACHWKYTADASRPHLDIMRLSPHTRQGELLLFSRRLYCSFGDLSEMILGSKYLILVSFWFVSRSSQSLINKSMIYIRIVGPDRIFFIQTFSSSWQEGQRAVISFLWSGCVIRSF